MNKTIFIKNEHGEWTPIKDKSIPKDIKFTPHHTCKPVEIEEKMILKVDKVVDDITNMVISENDKRVILNNVTQEEVSRIMEKYPEVSFISFLKLD